MSHGKRRVKMIIKKAVNIVFMVVFATLIVVNGVLPVAAWEKFPGVTIRTFTEEHDISAGALRRVAKHLERETGIKLIVEGVAEDIIYEKSAMVGTARTGDYDLLIMDNAWGPAFSTSGWVIPLDEYIAEDPGVIALDDFIPSFLDAFRSPFDEKLYAIPFYADAQMLLYRKDLFNDPDLRAQFLAKYGRPLLPPKNIYEYVETAKFFTKKYNPNSPTKYGSIEPRARGGIVSLCAFLEILYSLGGDVIYGQNAHALPVPRGMAGKSALEHPIAIEAAKQYQWLSSPELGIYPLEVQSYTSFDVVREFQTGTVPFMTAWSIIAGAFENPDISKVVGKVGWAPGIIFHGVFDRSIIGGRSSRVGGWGFGISRDSKNKEAAWETLKFIFSKENVKLLKGQPGESGSEPPRFSLYTDPEMIQRFPWFPTTLRVLLESRPVPMYPEFYKTLDIVQRKLSELSAGQITPEKAMEDASKELNRLNLTKYYKK